MMSSWFAVGAFTGALGVALGAFGAHGLRGRISVEMLAVFETGVRYQMIHALALLAVGWASTRGPAGWIAAAGWSFASGTLVFCGTLYGLALGGPRFLGAITPLGGLALILGWLALATASLRSA
jgi:uncharacterized membrane protein YgdD (TMEM256/DUF423 family)